ncbi:MAG: Transcriptional regulator, LysR family [Polyangiaceae bacterium]|jgi:DNA-binding transcriptional LysR family regulator|nr:Transcriptional regulator, LysR family [Polyangiaceae bacterium]
MSATIDLDLLSVFVEVASQASFSKAARTLGTTTATVSRNIGKLEEEVGSELLHRSTRQVSLSTAGAALFERAAPHVRALRSAARELPEQHEEPAGLLKIATLSDLGITLLGELIARFTLRYPKVRVQVELSSRRVDLVAEGFDLALRGSSGNERDSSLTVRRLIKHARINVYASPSYVARRGSPRALGSPEHDWLVSDPLLRVVALPKNVQPRLRANEFSLLREAARAGAGLALMPALMAEPLLQTGELVRVLPQWTISVGSLILLYPSSRRPPRKVTAFRDFLVAAFESSGLSAGA